MIAGGLGVLAGSAFSIRFDFGAGSSGSDFFLGEGDLSASEVFLLAGVAVALAFGFGVTSSSSSPDFLPGDFDAFGFGVGDASSSSSPAGVFFAFGVFVGSGVSVGFAFLLGFGVGVGRLGVDERAESRRECEARAEKNAESDHGRRA